MKTDIYNLSIHDFTFAILGNETDHFETEIDDILDRHFISRVEVIQYLRICIGDGGCVIISAIKSDMEEAFDDFFVRFTSVEIPNTGKLRGLIPSDVTLPNEILWNNENGREISLMYEDGEITDSDGQDFNSVQLIDEYRQQLGLTPMKDLDFPTYNQTYKLEISNLFRRLQKQHFEKHTLYAVAIDYLNERMGKIAVYDNPKSILTSKTNNISEKKPFQKEDNSFLCKMPEILKNELRGTKGKTTALLVRAAINLGWLSHKPKFSVLKEIGVMGNQNGYNKYFNPGSTVSLSDEEVENMMNYLKQNV